MDFAEAAEARGEMGVILRADRGRRVPQLLRILEPLLLQQPIIALHHLSRALGAVGIDRSFRDGRGIDG